MTDPYTFEPDERYEFIASALQAPEDERGYFIRQALNALTDDHPARRPLEEVRDGSITPALGLRAAFGELPDGPRGTGYPAGQEYAYDHGHVSLSLTPALVEWVELETDEGQSIEDWIERQVVINLRHTLHSNPPTITQDVDLPGRFVQRLRLMQSHQKARGHEATPVGEIAYNYVDWDVTWTLDNEPLFD